MAIQPLERVLGRFKRNEAPIAATPAQPDPATAGKETADGKKDEGVVKRFGPVGLVGVITLVLVSLFFGSGKNMVGQTEPEAAAQETKTDLGLYDASQEIGKRTLVTQTPPPAEPTVPEPAAGNPEPVTDVTEPPPLPPAAVPLPPPAANPVPPVFGTQPTPVLYQPAPEGYPQPTGTRLPNPQAAQIEEELKKHPTVYVAERTRVAAAQRRSETAPAIPAGTIAKAKISGEVPAVMGTDVMATLTEAVAGDVPLPVGTTLHGTVKAVQAERVYITFTFAKTPERRTVPVTAVVFDGKKGGSGASTKEGFDFRSLGGRAVNAGMSMGLSLVSTFTGGYGSLGGLDVNQFQPQVGYKQPKPRAFKGGDILVYFKEAGTDTALPVTSPVQASAAPQYYPPVQTPFPAYPTQPYQPGTQTIPNYPAQPAPWPTTTTGWQPAGQPQGIR